MRGALAALCVLIAGTAAAELPQPFTAHYTLTANGIRAAESSRILRGLGEGVWEFETVAKPVGVAALFVRDTIRENSRWRLNGSGEVIPLRYKYHQQGGRRERHREITFQHGDELIRSTLNDQQWPLPRGVQDIASVQIALMMDVARGKTRMQYPIADGRKVETYRFEVMGEGRLNTPAGQFHTVRIEQQDVEPGRSMNFWLAAELGYLPVRIEHHNADRTISRVVLQLQSLVPDPR